MRCSMGKYSIDLCVGRDLGDKVREGYRGKIDDCRAIVTVIDRGTGGSTVIKGSTKAIVLRMEVDPRPRAHGHKFRTHICLCHLTSICELKCYCTPQRGHSIVVRMLPEGRVLQFLGKKIHCRIFLFVPRAHIGGS